MAGKDAQAPVPVHVYRQGNANENPLVRWSLKKSFKRALRHLSLDADVVNSHHRPDYLDPKAFTATPTALSFHGPLAREDIGRLSKRARRHLWFTGLSRNHIRGVSGFGQWQAMPYAVDSRLYRPAHATDQSAHLAFLGRIWRPKGVHTAIRVAKATGNKLVVAGNVVDHPDSRSLPYWENEIRPQIDGRQIVYVGEVDDAKKNEILSGAKALLFPIEWEEPFGLVMLEALACGTPVIAFRRGAVPEVITDGVDGFICDDFEGMVEAVKRVESIDRRACRRTVETRFTVDHMVDRYEALYRSMLEAR